MKRQDSELEDDHSFESSSDKTIKSPEMLYQENGLFHRYDVEWRYRIMSRFFLTTAGLLFVAKWLWEDPKGVEYIGAPFVLISLLSLGFYFLDRRVISQIRVSGEVAMRLERILHPDGGHFVGLSGAGRVNPGSHKGNWTIISFSSVLQILYLGTAFGAAFIAIYASFITVSGCAVVGGA